MSDNYNGPELARQVIRLRAEIEQLRAANIGLATESHELQQEVERLRAALETIKNAGFNGWALPETERLQEIARAALAPGDVK